MSQSAFSIPNEPGANFRADVNTALQALASKSSGATAPATTYPYQPWYDTTLNLLKVRNGANNAWVIVGPEADSTQNVLYTNNTAQTYTDNTGKTGFGVPTPGYKVDVSGDVNASGVFRVAGVAQTNAARSTIASASTVDLGSVNSSGITISGTTTVTSFGSSAAAGTIKNVTLSGAVPITYNATSMILPGGASITGASGDTFIAESLGSGNWRVLNYTLASGTAVNLSKFTNSLGADVSLSSTGSFFDGPSVAQGTTGTWFASGTVTLLDNSAAVNYLVKLWDGTTVISSIKVNTDSASRYVIPALSGYITNPAANIRISVQNLGSTSGKIIANASGTGKDSTLSVIRIG